jgi:hypothetical protein
MNTTIPFARLPEHAKRQAAPDLMQGKQWFWFGSIVEPPEVRELAQWINPAGNGFTGTCGTDSDSPAGNKSSGAMLRNADISRKLAAVPHAKKRFLADCLIAAKPNLSNRELARVAGVSHTYIANRRRITKGGNK